MRSLFAYYIKKGHLAKKHFLDTLKWFFIFCSSCRRQDSNLGPGFKLYFSKILISDGADGAFYPDEIQRPPVRVPSWGLEDNVVCSQPAET